MSRPDRFTDLPRDTAHGGFIYAISFSNGTIKVGSTYVPADRFAAHARAAGTFDIDIDDWWLSEAHADYLQSERALIGAVREMGGRRSRREYFHGLQFHDVVQAACGICRSGSQFTWRQRLGQANSVVALLDRGDLAAASAAMAKAGISAGRADDLIRIYLSERRIELAGVAA